MAMLVNVKDGTPEWHQWRSLGIGGSDAPAILGVSPYKTAYQLWLEKTGAVEPENIDGSPQIQAGNRLEPKARKSYEDLTGLVISSACLQSELYPWMRLSADGVSIDGRHAVEIKYLGRETWNRVLNDSCIPEHHRIQMLHYVAVGQFETVDYVGINDQEQIAVVPFKWTNDELARLLWAEIDFWQKIIASEEPEKSEADIDDLTGNNEFNSLMLDYQQLLAESKLISDRLLACKSKLQGFAADRSVESEAGKVTRYWVAGRTDAAKFLKDSDIEVPEKYRKAGQWQYRITPKGEK